MKVNTSKSLNETRDIASEWLKSVIDKTLVLNSCSKDAGKLAATVVGLSGHLGAGKTAFVKLVASLLGVKGEVTSPTFVIMKMYEINVKNKDQHTPSPLSPRIRSSRISKLAISNVEDLKSIEEPAISSNYLRWRRLVHIDAYRLERPEELVALKFDELVADPSNLILIEWPENVKLKDKVPECIELKFEVVDDGYRISIL